MSKGIIGYHAMQRDASWFANPGRALKYHIATGDNVARCNPLMPLNESASIRIERKNLHMVCKRCIGYTTTPAQD